MAGGNTFENKITILAELWMNYRDDEDLQDFVEYNDLGLPLAYFLMNEIVLPTSQSELYINETYDYLLLLYKLRIKSGKALMSC
jgi:hypothetical protein